METATAKPELEPPDLPEESRYKVIPFERSAKNNRCPRDRTLSVGINFLSREENLLIFA